MEQHTHCIPQSKVYRLSIDHHIRRIVIKSDDIRERQILISPALK